MRLWMKNRRIAERMASIHTNLGVVILAIRFSDWLVRAIGDYY